MQCVCLNAHSGCFKNTVKDKRGAGAAAVLRHGGDGDEDGSREGRERSTKTNYVLF